MAIPVFSIVLIVTLVMIGGGSDSPKNIQQPSHNQTYDRLNKNNGLFYVDVNSVNYDGNVKSFIDDYDDDEEDDDDLFASGNFDEEDDFDDEDENECDDEDEDDEEEDDEDEDAEDEDAEDEDKNHKDKDDKDKDHEVKIDDDDEIDPIDSEIEKHDANSTDTEKRFDLKRKTSRLQKYIQILNSRQSTWKASVNHILRNPWKIRKRIMASAFVDQEAKRSLHTVKHEVTKDTHIPESFDPRKEWPYCAKVIGTIRDQITCGSCWAESVAGAMSDRVCIETKGKHTEAFSTVDLGCCKSCLLGNDPTLCNGGNGNFAWGYIQRTGVVTGDEYRHNVGCKPFTMKAAMSKCVHECTNHHYKKSYKEDRFRTSRTYQLSLDVKQIQLELMKHGPMETSLALQAEFCAYSHGVYKPNPKAKFIGWHSVRLIGWGTEKGEPYWLLANSWSKYWGEKGFFRISQKR